MKRKTGDDIETKKEKNNTGDEVSITSASSLPNPGKKRKLNLEEKLHKKYMKKVKEWFPTFPDDEISGLVNERFPGAMASILELFDISSSYTYLLPEDRIKNHLTAIIIDTINVPVRQLIYTHMLHFQQMKSVIETFKNDEKTSQNLTQVLTNMEPPAEGEVSFAEYVNVLNSIIKGVIKRVAGVIESREIIKGDRKTSNIVLNQIKLDYNIKADICVFLTNFICMFAGEDIYNYFMDNENFVQKTVSMYITKM